jgi:hypothetical protein
MMREWSAVVILEAMGSMNLMWMRRGEIQWLFRFEGKYGLGSKIFRWSHMLTLNPYHLVYPVV